jgi:CheY-like chemotaxis protein
MRPKKKVIILVDDNDQVLSIRTFLLETRGYRVHPFSSSAAALVFLTSCRPDSIDLLLSDLVMPEMDGNELVRRAKQLHPHLPTMIVSGTVENYDRASAADVFLPKGCTSAAEILESVRIKCARKRGPRKWPVAFIPSDEDIFTEEVRRA